jgi:SecD/SecF fusion protein
MPEQKTNRLWLWIVIGVGLLMTMLASLSVLAFVTLPMILQATGSKPGGAVLIYEVDPDSVPPGTTVNMESLTAAVNRRVNGGRGWNRIARVRELNDRRIEVALIGRNEADTERVKRLLARIGTLEFRILADKRKFKDLVDQALRNPSKMTVLDSAGNPRAWWVLLKAGEEQSFDENIARRTRKGPGDKGIEEILVLNDIYNVTGGYLTNATAEIDQQGRPSVGFYFNRTGGQLFGKLTDTHRPDEQQDFYYRLGIILDGALYSAPRIMTVITDRGQITGSFTQTDVQDLADVLNSGSFPARIRLVGEKMPP